MTNPTPNVDFFAFWKDFLQQSSDFWTHTATLSQPPAPIQLWQQFFNIWATFWLQTCTQVPSAEIFPAVQKSWTEQLNGLAQAFDSVMKTEAYSTTQSKFLEQHLVWQNQMTKMLHPQTDAALQMLHLPSRYQIDRLFERVIGIEERFNDLEDAIRHILQKLPEVPSVLMTDVEAQA